MWSRHAELPCPAVRAQVSRSVYARVVTSGRPAKLRRLVPRTRLPQYLPLCQGEGRTWPGLSLSDVQRAVAPLYIRCLSGPWVVYASSKVLQRTE
jgi:hypothetical protein